MCDQVIRFKVGTTMAIVQRAQLRCRSTQHDANEIFKHKSVSHFFFQIRCNINLSSLKQLGVQHVQREQYWCFAIEWAWSEILEFLHFFDVLARFQLH